MGSEFRWHPEKMAAEVDRWVQRRVKAAVYFYERTLQELFRSAKTGRIYGAEQTVNFNSKSGGSGSPLRITPVSFTAHKGKVLGGKGKAGSRVHQASAPGEPPAIDTGRLRQSITHKITRLGWASYAAKIGSNVAYAMYLEFGTKRMAPRPAWVPALKKLQENINQVFQKADGGGIK